MAEILSDVTLYDITLPLKLKKRFIVMKAIYKGEENKCSAMRYTSHWTNIYLYFVIISLVLQVERTSIFSKKLYLFYFLIILLCTQ